MELEGLKRGLRHITELNGVQVHDLVTDRHVMIKSYMKTERPNMNHYFDVWHVAKGNQILNFVSLKKDSCKKAWCWSNPSLDKEYSKPYLLGCSI